MPKRNILHLIDPDTPSNPPDRADIGRNKHKKRGEKPLFAHAARD